MAKRLQSSDARVDLAGIVAEVGACPERAMILTLPSIQDGWDGRATLEQCRWFTATFIDSPQENGRLWRGVGAVRKFYQSLAKLHYDITGEVAPLDEVLIEALSRRVMQAMYPSNYEVATGAKSHSVQRASMALQKFIPEEKWRKKYSF